MRRLFIAFLLLCAPLLQAQEMPEVQIEDVVWYYKPEKVFKRIGEYFDGEERFGRKIVLRTQESPREGLYYIVRISEFADALPDGCAFEVDMLRPDMKEPTTNTFQLPDERKSHREIWLGFIGEDHPAEEEAPVAWRIKLLDPQGKVVATKESFLWSKPPAEQPADAAEAS
ncbi:hypothetical protein [Cerasicoccus maritimus]|uniref:hypothetical protein n=1 Tax=Cerasicoccus maritimus TaxID=490089 RepID=UPI00285254D8|nr:hypothetical protein [Cerasicoccus maritimus]